MYCEMYEREKQSVVAMVFSFGWSLLLKIHSFAGFGLPSPSVNKINSYTHRVFGGKTKIRSSVKNFFSTTMDEVIEKLDIQEAANRNTKKSKFSILQKPIFIVKVHLSTSSVYI